MLAVSSLLKFALQNSVAHVPDSERFVCVFADVEKAFDNVRLQPARAAFSRLEADPHTLAAMMTEMLGSKMMVGVGDTSVGPLPHCRGKTGRLFDAGGLLCGFG